MTSELIDGFDEACGEMTMLIFDSLASPRNTQFIDRNVSPVQGKMSKTLLGYKSGGEEL